MKKALLALIILFGISAFSFDTIPFQVGIWQPNVQIVPDEINVAGVKINLPYGGNKNITGLDIGFASTSDYTSALQINLVMNQANEQFSGVQFACVNQSENSEWLTVGLMNITSDRARGIQLGILNSTMEMRGLQLGILNYTERMSGVQLGFINLISESPVMFFPIINMSF